MKYILFIMLTMFGLSAHIQANTVTVAVASNFAEPLKALKTQFEQIHPNIKLNIVIGSSGKLFAQIQHGAPFDVFLSADQFKPAKLIDNGFAIKGSQYTYAQGSLVLWSNLDEPATLESISTHKGKLAIANPKTAPYGEAAKQVLNTFDHSNIQIINANNIIGVSQYVFSQSVEMGLVAKSSIAHLEDSELNIWLVDETLYSPILQDLVLLNHTPFTQLFIDFLKSEQAGLIISQFGYKRIL